MQGTSALVAILALGLSFTVQAQKQAPLEKPLVVAHRGFPSLIPEETIAGYTKAVAAGTDFIEMDIVSTKDGVLVLRHDLTLDDSTDILSHPEFAGRNKTYFQPFDKKNQTGFYIADFTLAELRTLYMTQAFKWRDSSLNKMNRIVTLDEILAFGSKVWESDRPVGLYIETKGVEYHDQIGLPLEKKIMESIARSGLANYSDTAIILQSFEIASLPKMKQYGEELGLATPPLVYLLNSEATSCNVNITDAELDALPGMGIYFIGPPKDALVGGYVFDPACNRVNSSSPTAGCTSQVNQTCTGRLSPAFAAAYNGSAPFPDNLVKRAHQRGIGVHPYTFRNEGQYMALDFNNDPLRELQFFGGPGGMGVDGFFGDNAMTMEAWWASVTSDGFAENRLAPQYE